VTVEHLQLIDAAQLAAWLNVSPATLERWRSKGDGPPWFKLGDARQAPVRYRRQAVREWIDANTFSSTAEAAAAQQ